MRSALSAKLNENSVAVVDAFSLQSHKTKEFQKIIMGLGFSGKVLIVDSSGERNLALSARNLPKVKLVPSTGVNIFDVVNSNTLLFSKDSILRVQEVLSR
jgi:large subunit ribosomal protein L4